MGDFKEVCPKCHRSSVYSMHSLDRWTIYCYSCGLETKPYDTWKKARAEWDKMVEQINGK